MVRDRAPELQSRLREVGGLRLEQVEAALAFWVGVLREHGSDLLAGDLTRLEGP